MMVDVFNMEGEKVRSVELPESIFEAPIFTDLMHQAYTRQMANARLGTHDTKTRSEVAGGGRKPWNQKGTGRARQGSTRAPHWKGGGRIHTPHPHGYSQAMPRKMRRAALRSALSVKAAEASIVLVEELKLAEPKTRLMAKALYSLVGDQSALILITEKAAYSDVIRATNNLPDVKVLNANYLNIRDLLVFNKLVIPVLALDTISANLG
jgi:large subunit ribosomal protein L4